MTQPQKQATAEISGAEHASNEAARKFLVQRQEMAAERYAWQERALTAEAESARLRVALERLRQMADAWEERLPAAIRTATAADAIRTTIDGAL